MIEHLRGEHAEQLARWILSRMDYREAWGPLYFTIDRHEDGGVEVKALRQDDAPWGPLDIVAEQVIS